MTLDVISRTTTMGPEVAAEFIRRASRRLDGLGPFESFLLVSAILAAVYLPTANYGPTVNIDVSAAAAPAWELANHGTLYVDDLEPNPWYQEVGDHTVSNRFPGATLWALPWYWAFREPTAFTVWQSTLASVFAATLAMGVLNLLLRRVAVPSRAFWATLLAGLGTATWPMSARELWTHGPSQLFIGLAALALASDLPFLSGLSLGAGILVRPPIGFLAAGIGATKSWINRSVRTLLLVGAGSAIGVVALLAYNFLLYSRLTVVGGYDPAFLQRLVGLPITSYARELAAAFVAPHNGLLIWSPFLIILLPGFPAAWRIASPWVKSLAVGALIYTLVHIRSGGASGMTPFDYRYLLGPLVAASPFLFLAYSRWVQPRPFACRLFLGAALFSVGLQALVAVTMKCTAPAAGPVMCSLF